MWDRLAGKSQSVANLHYQRSRDDLRNDVHLSLDYAMRQGVFVSNDPLSDEKAATLFHWFLLLRKTLPPTWTALHAVVQELIDNLFTFSGRKSI